eukprot:4502223-Pleurochrysis_carterae.AAC.1
MVKQQADRIPRNQGRVNEAKIPRSSKINAKAKERERLARMRIGKEEEQSTSKLPRQVVNGKIRGQRRECRANCAPRVCRICARVSRAAARFAWFTAGGHTLAVRRSASRCRIEKLDTPMARTCNEQAHTSSLLPNQRSAHPTASRRVATEKEKARALPSTLPQKLSHSSSAGIADRTVADHLLARVASCRRRRTRARVRICTCSVVSGSRALEPARLHQCLLNSVHLSPLTPSLRFTPVLAFSLASQRKNSLPTLNTKRAPNHPAQRALPKALGQHDSVTAWQHGGIRAWQRGSMRA